jgi:hypothetical protein
MPRQVFTAGEILTAASMNDLADATVMVFDDSAARGSAIPTPSEGMVTYLKDTNQVQAFNGSAFAPLGTILQVVSVTKTDTFSTASTTFVDITGVTASITPSSTSSKIMVFAETAGGSDNDVTVHFRVARGGTALNVGDVAGSRVQATFSIFSNNANVGGRVSVVNGNSTFLDSPASTSSLTYTLQMRVNTGNGYVGRNGENSDNAFAARTPTNLTLMEVAG